MNCFDFYFFRIHITNITLNVMKIQHLSNVNKHVIVIMVRSSVFIFNINIQLEQKKTKHVN